MIQLGEFGAVRCSVSIASRTGSAPGAAACSSGRIQTESSLRK
jgi:hypothetical protein